VTGVKATLRAGFAKAERALDRLCGTADNPLNQLGAIGWFLFWIVTASGIYLYIFFDTGVTQAYQSIDAITREQWYAGGVMRSLHRYASDALVVVVLAHLLQEFALDRLRGRRWFSWITGLPLLAFIYACGITGYWMVWDALAQYVATTTTQWLDALPIFAEPIAGNFTANANLSGRFFTLMVYLHIAIPLVLLLFMWIHIQRHNYANVNPPRRLAVILTGALVVLSLVYPAVSQAPANLDLLPASVGLDWFYLATSPLIERWGGGVLWLIVAATFALLAVMPWLPKMKTAAAAVVNLDNCNGCMRCFADCPFSAITMQPRSDGAAFEREAVVDPDLCVSCGICVGSCPTATPFRRAAALKAGIELPGLPLDALRERIEALGAAPDADDRVLVFSCQRGATLPVLPAGSSVLELPCVGMLPPSFIDLAISRRFAAGVMLAGCGEGACYHRMGISWTKDRIGRARDPQLRERVPRERIGFYWAGAGAGITGNAIADFQQHVRQLGRLDRSTVRATGATPWRSAAARGSAVLRYVTAGTLLAVAGIVVGYLSRNPVLALLNPGESVITLSFSHAAPRREECTPFTPAELAKLQPNMRRPAQCPRERWPVLVELQLDGRTLVMSSLPPVGLWDDGPASIFRRVTVSSGPRTVTVRLRDTGRLSGFDYEASRQVVLSPRQNLVIGFSANSGFTFR
jgi:ferredoxin/coenzyme F420-reducing hydrogenase delta subunit